ncbi:hypothetical protein KR51_00029760 [Rubidibacter lacunae KORDI 51-2]|uniref:Uncharacterized protein n=1 Tax=Rubidibacter lacunae KORDI 51-2 TaxID=582515 RepID=U5DL34_9CHRO|nr:hypothetical protein [Rubidibacter lacunae]ERN40435.1 hypothetical protein KR51_00029760 [Rubidibacter lacunae KORDI 51-2]
MASLSGRFSISDPDVVYSNTFELLENNHRRSTLHGDRPIDTDADGIYFEFATYQGIRVRATDRACTLLEQESLRTPSSAPPTPASKSLIDFNFA